MKEVDVIDTESFLFWMFAPVILIILAIGNRED